MGIALFDSRLVTILLLTAAVVVTACYVSLSVYVWVKLIIGGWKATWLAIATLPGFSTFCFLLWFCAAVVIKYTMTAFGM